MSKEKQIIEEMAKVASKCMTKWLNNETPKVLPDYIAEAFYNAGYRKQEWISVDERLPTEDEYLTHHNDGLDTLKRITVAYMTDTIEYTIGCYDGYKWMNQLGNKKINDVVAWKPFELYEAPKGGAE
jgi:hypothetical protein